MERYFNETLSNVNQDHSLDSQNVYTCYNKQHVCEGSKPHINDKIICNPTIETSSIGYPSQLSISSLSSSSSDRINHHQHHSDITLNNVVGNQLSSGTFMDSFANIPNSLIIAQTTCLSIILAYKLIVYLVFGKLRVPEHQHVRKAFRDYFIQKLILILMILDVRDYHDRLPWAIWYTAVGSILLLSTLCRDRFEYLSASPSIKNWSLIKIDFLMTILFTVTIISTSIVFFKHSTTTHGLLLFADSMYALTFVTSVIWRFIVLTYDMRTDSLWENRATIIYYSDLIFATLLFTIDFLHNLHLCLLGLAVPIKLWCLMNIRRIFLDTRRRYRRHINYRTIVQLMETNFPMASQEEMDKNCDDCAICWDEMKAARKLPCGHLFHHSCLRSWLEQDTSCPTCRTSLKTHHDVLMDDIEDRSESEEEFIETTRPHQRNHFFHFDSSRYTNNRILSWLPTISIEGFM